MCALTDTCLLFDYRISYPLRPILLIIQSLSLEADLRILSVSRKGDYRGGCHFRLCNGGFGVPHDCQLHFWHDAPPRVLSQSPSLGRQPGDPSFGVLVDSVLRGFVPSILLLIVLPI